MKSLRSLLAAASVAAALSVSAFAAVESEPGYVDVGQLVPSAKGEFVEVNLSPAMLKFAARMAAREEPAAAELLGNLKRVRVNVVSLDDSNRAAAVEQVASIRRKLESAGWSQMVTVREKGERSYVDVYVKQRNEDSIDGLVVTVIDEKGEAVVVNIVGNISADQIAKVADNLNIEPLKHVRVKAKHRKDKAQDEDEA